MQSIALEESVIEQTDKECREPLRQNESLRRLAVRMERKTGSYDSWHAYVKEAVRFAAFMDKAPDELVASKVDWAGAVNDYLDELHGRKLSSSSMLLAVYGIKKFLSTNDVVPQRSEIWTRVDLPRRVRTGHDRLPRKEELRRIIEAGDLSDRVMVTVAVSSGLRRGSLFHLQLKHIDLSREIPIVRPPMELVKGRVSFFTFITPEAKAAIRAFIKDRELSGEVINDDSYLIPSQAKRGAPFTRIGAGRKWIRLLQTAGYTAKGGAWYELHMHVLRKFFRTYSTLAGANSDAIEFFMGHRSGLKGAYYVPDADSVAPEVVQQLEDQYRRAIPGLTVFDDEIQIKKLEANLEDKARDYEMLDAKVKKLTEKVGVLTSQLATRKS